MKHIIFFFFLCFTSLGLSAQVEVQEDFPINLMMDAYIESNRSVQMVEGWRIQIMAKTDRQSIEKAKEDFMLDFPGVQVDWTHSKPYYRLKAGAFLTKLEAIRMLQEFKSKYPGSFPVKDDISKEELIGEL